ncbi:MFS transporter [Leifsonia kafniensis]|uniref:MFS transporter n=1 Tax=Leifsonia kafniensis TaxID=475957 RepID=A0ABP7KQJ6_9MICO
MTSTHTQVRPAHGGARVLDWKFAGMLMGITFSGLQMLNEVGVLMAIPLYRSMSMELGLTPTQVSWALVATLLMGAISISVLSRAGDLFGHRRVLVISVVAIAVGYVISALATNFETLMIGRALTGITAGQALVIGIMNDRLSPENRRKTIGIIAGGQAIGVTLGFVLGGVMIQLGATWRDSFWLGAGLTVLSLIGLLLWGSDSDAVLRRRNSVQRLDLVSTSILGLSLTAVCIGISQSTLWGFLSAPTLLFTIGGIIGLGIWLAWERKSADPLIDVSLLLSRRLLPAYAVFLAMGLSGMMIFNVVLGYAQTPTVVGYGFGMTPLVAGLLFLPETIAGIVVGQWIPKLLGRSRPRAPFIGGAVLLLVTFVWMYFMHTEVWGVVIGIFAYGVAYTMLLTIAVSVIAAAAPVGKGASAASIYPAVAGTGAAIGAAVFGAVIGIGVTPENPVPAAGNYAIGWLFTILAGVIAILATASLSKHVELTERIELTEV